MALFKQVDSILRGSNQKDSYRLACTIRPFQLPSKQSKMMKIASEELNYEETNQERFFFFLLRYAHHDDSGSL